MSVEKGQLYEMEITKLGDSGEGIAHYKDMNIFVSGAVVGDFVKVKITEIKKTYATGKIVKMIRSSKLRTVPPCPHFRTCGVCQIMNMDYQKGQLTYKQGVVETALSQYESLKSAKVLPILGMKDALRYRTTALYSLGQGHSGIKLGFYEKASHKVVDVEDCLLQHDSHIKINQVIRTFIAEFGLLTYDEGSHKGQLRQVLIRESHANGDLMVVIIVNAKQLPKDTLLAERLVKAVPQIKSVVINENTLKANRGLGPINKQVYGDATLEDELMHMTFTLHPETDFPANVEMAETYYKSLMDFAKLPKEATILNLYPSDAVLKSILEQEAKTVLGAVDLPKLLEESHSIDLAVLDPPKKGCDAAKIDSLLQLAPQKIIYLSNKPSVMARDLNAICESGLYEVTLVQAVDLNPMMTQVDCLALIEKKLV